MDGRTLKSIVQYKLNSALLETKKEKEKNPGLADEGRIWEELGGREGVVMIKIYCMHAGNPQRVNTSIFFLF